MRFATPSTRATSLVCLALIAICFFPLRQADYIQDDHVAIESNEIVARADLTELFSTSYWEGASGSDNSLYRPLVLSTFALETTLWGADRADRSHIVNVAIHAGATLAWILLLTAMGFRTWAVFCAAALFAVHPIHTEAVAGLVGRSELMAAGFGMLSLGTLASIRSFAPGWDVRWKSWVAALATLAALLSKETAAAIPVLIVLLLLLRLWNDERPIVTRLLAGWGAMWPSLIATLVWLFLRVRALQDWFVSQPIHPLDNPLVHESGFTQLATALAVLAKYTRLLLVPLGLSIDYSGPGIPIRTNLTNLASAAGLLILIGWVAIGIWTWHKRRRHVTWMLFLFWVPYAIIGNLFFDVGALVAERFLYLPSAGFCGLAGWILGLMESGELPHEHRGPEFGRRVMVVSVTAMVAAFSLLTWVRCTDWKNDRTIFNAALIVQPNSPRANFVVGKFALEDGNPTVAIDFMDRAIAVHPGHFPAHQEKGIALGKLGRLDEAIEMLERATELNPQSFRAHQNLAIAYRRRGRTRDAERELKTALAWEPDAANAWTELGNLYLDLARYDGAIDAYARATQLGRRDLAPRIARARQLAAQKESR